MTATTASVSSRSAARPRYGDGARRVQVAPAATVAAGATWTRRPPSPYLGRAADLLDTLAVVAVIPVACAVLGLYGMASTINI